jgi:hypothetical protein
LGRLPSLFSMVGGGRICHWRRIRGLPHQYLSHQCPSSLFEQRQLLVYRAIGMLGWRHRCLDRLPSLFSMVGVRQICRWMRIHELPHQFLSHQCLFYFFVRMLVWPKIHWRALDWLQKLCSMVLVKHSCHLWQIHELLHQCFCFQCRSYLSVQMRLLVCQAIQILGWRHRWMDKPPWLFSMVVGGQICRLKRIRELPHQFLNLQCPSCP